MSKRKMWLRSFTAAALCAAVALLGGCSRAKTEPEGITGIWQTETGKTIQITQTDLILDGLPLPYSLEEPDRAGCCRMVISGPQGQLEGFCLAEGRTLYLTVEDSLKIFHRPKEG